MSLFVELPLRSYACAQLATLNAADVYDFEIARGMAWISQLAYETADRAKVAEVLANWALAEVTLLKSPVSGPLRLVDSRGLVARGWGGTIVAFAGTDPVVPANWLTNFRSLPSPDDIHSGFEDAVKSVWPEVRSAVLEQKWGHQPLFLTGHSLGGALAVVAAKLLREDGSANVGGVYTFGMPRCGGQRFADQYDRDLGPRTYRFVHGDDIVPTVPPMNLGFRHVGCLLRCAHGKAFDPNSKPVAGPDDGASFAGTVLQGIRDAFQTLRTAAVPAATQPGLLGEAYRFLPPGIGDHVPSRYLSALGYKL
jgi:triacylglycerol lipase